jgi:glycosyltransferase involved in cell wall biosynthesis
MRVMHLLSGLGIGGKERVALELATYGRAHAQDHTLLLYDHPYRPSLRDFDPGDVPWCHLPREPGLDMHFAWRLGRLIADQVADVVHAHNETAIAYGGLALALARNRRTRLIGTYHTWPSARSVRARLLARWAAGRSASVVAVSDDLAVRLLGAGWTERCSVIPNGVNAARFVPAMTRSRPAPRAARERRFVVNVARCDAIKGQADLIAAADIVHRVCPDIVLLIAGDGPALTSLRQQALGRGYIRCIGAVRDVAAILRRAEVFVLPSHDEGTPLALLEAMAAGCPPIATNVGGVRSILISADLQAGLLVPPRDPQALAAAILKVLVDTDCAAALRKSAQKRAADFSAERMWQEYRKLYGE